MVAPGRVVTLESPRSPAEVQAILKASRPVGLIVNRQEATVQLPENARQMHLWIEPMESGGTRLIAQMRTPYRAALMRLCITLLLFGLAAVLAFMARFWFSLFFLVFAALFLLLSQYERVIGRDLRKHIAWLQAQIGAKPITR
jgi:hypothetical protein